MIGYLGRRLGAGVISLVVFTLVLFWLVEAVVPGDAVTMCRLTNPAEVCGAIREQMGINDPIVVRWWRWLATFRETAFGLETFVGSASLGQVLPPTIFVFVSGLLLAYLIGQWLGRITGWRRSLLSDAVTLTGVSFTTLFPPFLGFVVVTILGLHLRTLRARFLEDQRRELWFNGPFTESDVLGVMTWTLLVGVLVAVLVSVVMWRWRRDRLAPSVTALVAVAVMLVLWRVQGVFPWALDLAFDAALPLLAFTLLAFGEFMLIMQTGMVGVLNEDFVETARAKGLSERMVRDRHAARNASLVVLARLAVSIPYLLTGLVIIEHAVGWHGIGSFLFRAIDSQDIPATVSTFALIGLLTLVVRLTLDMLTMLADPRIARPVKER